MSSPAFLLASASPRRRDLLEALGIPFAVVPNPWTEVPHPGEAARAQVERLAREKLDAYLRAHPDTELPVLTADTLLALGRRPLGKPADEAEALAIYRALAGRRHRVLTSVALADPRRGRRLQRTVATTVAFVPWDEALYRRYLARGEWVDAAGGYKIQEGGRILVSAIWGSWTNVVGLPMAEVSAMLSATLRV